MAGKVREIANKADHTIRYINVIHFYDENGQLLYRSKIPSEMVIFRNLGCIWGLILNLTLIFTNALQIQQILSTQLRPLHGATMINVSLLLREIIYMLVGYPQTLLPFSF